MSSVLSPDGSGESYRYDVQGWRQQKIAGGVVTTFPWDDQNLLWEEI